MTTKLPARKASNTPEALITFRVSVLSQVLARVVEASVSRDLGLTSRQWRLLVVLDRLGPSKSGDVARFSHLDHSQVSRAGFELTGLGLVKQQSDAKDRRKVTLSLTPAGRRILARGLSGSRTRQERLEGRLSRADSAALTRALEALTEEAKTMLREARAAG